MAKEVVAHSSQSAVPNVLSPDGPDLGIKVKFAEGGKPEFAEENPLSQID